MKNILTFLLLVVYFCLPAQDISEAELKLQKLLKSIHTSESDSLKLKSNSEFTDLLQKTISSKESFYYPFDSLKTIAKLTSEDKAFRIFNWNVPLNDGTHKYFAFLQLPLKDGIRIVTLIDQPEPVKNLETAQLTPEKWHGCLYYKIITKKHRRKKSYILLAWDGNDKLTWKKYIDVMSIDKRGNIKFGESIFEHGKVTKKRVVFEYKNGASFSLKYEPSTDMIVFNFLMSENQNYKNYKQFWVPEGSFDAFKYKKGKWKLVEDVDARGKPNKRDNDYKRPEAPIVGPDDATKP